MDFDLNDRVALITGGGRGIGKAIGLTLAAHGVNVALCGRTPETLEQTAAEIRARGVEAWPIRADVTRLEDIQRFVGDAAAAAGRVDILVNNAVSSTKAPFDEQTDDHWRHHIDVKLMAYIRSIREVLPHMRKRGWGRIVNIGGMTARITAGIRVTNGVVNAGIANLTKQLAGEVGKDTITINCIHPGSTATERLVDRFVRIAQDENTTVEAVKARIAAETPLGRLIEPSDIAATALYFCSPMADMVTGQSIAVDGGSSTSVNY